MLHRHLDLHGDFVVVLEGSTLRLLIQLPNENMWMERRCRVCDFCMLPPDEQDSWGAVKLFVVSGRNGVEVMNAQECVADVNLS